MKSIIVILTAALIGVTSISAKGECQADRQKFCAKVMKGDHKGMWTCIKSHEAELSEGCKNHISAVREKSKDIKKNCKADYKKLCKKEKSGDGRIIKCLKANEASLSEGCKDALNKTELKLN